MKVNYIDAQYVGKSHYDDSNGGKPRTYCHFLYQSNYIDGYGTIVFCIFDNNPEIKVSDMKIKDNYHVRYVSDKGYNQVVTIEKI